MLAVVRFSPEQCQDLMSDQSPKTGIADQSSDQVSDTEKSDAFESEMQSLEDAGEDTEQLRRDYLLRRFGWHTASRFWTDRRSHMAWMLSALLLLIILLNLAASYAMNLWNRSIFDALEKKEASTVLTLSMIISSFWSSVWLSASRRFTRG